MGNMGGGTEALIGSNSFFELPVYFFIFVYIHFIMIDIPEEELVRKGKMTKSPFDMTLEEEREWQIKTKLETRAYLFSIGQPLVYVKDGVMIAEYADGRIVPVH